MNRRNVLLTIVNAVISFLLPGKALARKVSKKEKYDRRLIGTWRSDKELTLKYWRWMKELDKNKQQQYEDIFGKLELRYTETHIFQEFEGQKNKYRYYVLGKDEYSVAILSHDELGDGIQHIHFKSDDVYYILSGMINVEFFRRVIG